MDFFDTGTVEFKGVNVPVFDTVFLEREANRLEYRDRMGTLYDSLGQGLWSSRVFADALNLMARIVSSSSEALVDDATGQGIDATDPISVMQRIKKAQGFYQAERYEQAVAEFSELVDAFVSARGRDAIATEYLVSVRDKYRLILELFVSRLDGEIDEHLEAIFVNQTDRANYRTLEKHHGMYASVRDAARLKVADRRNPLDEDHRVRGRVPQSQYPSQKVAGVTKAIAAVLNDSEEGRMARSGCGVRSFGLCLWFRNSPCVLWLTV